MAWLPPSRRSSSAYDPEGGRVRRRRDDHRLGAGADEAARPSPNPVQGRLLTVDDEGTHVVVMGSDLARKENVASAPGHPGRDFEVVGVLEPT